MDTPLLDPPTGGSAVTRVTEGLRRRVVALELPPDTVLIRADLAREFGVSLTPLREALQRLETEGLVHIFPQSRTVVSRIDTRQIAEAHMLRVAVETEAQRRLAPICDDATLVRLEMLVAMQRAAADSGDMTALQELDEAFHRTLITAAGYPGLHQLIRSRSGHLNRLRRLDLPDEGKVRRILSGHQALTAALAAHDGEAAVAAIRDHLSQTISRMDVLRARFPDHFEP